MRAIPSENYCSKRLRIVIFLLVFTGIQIQQLMNLKVFQVESLHKTNFSSLLTSEGKILWKDRQKDFEDILVNKMLNSYLLTAKSRPNQPLTRETITREINKVLKKVSQNSSSELKLTNYSLRTG